MNSRVKAIAIGLSAAVGIALGGAVAIKLSIPTDSSSSDTETLRSGPTKCTSCSSACSENC